MFLVSCANGPLVLVSAISLEDAKKKLKVKEVWGTESRGKVTVVIPAQVLQPFFKGSRDERAGYTLEEVPVLL